MQSPTSSKSKYYQNIPHRQQNTKKPKNLQNAKVPQTIPDEHSIGTTKRKSQWMSDFTQSQKQIIEGQLSKMMKTLKKKLSSPNKSVAIGVQSLGNKTQRWNQGENIAKVQQTARKKKTKDKNQAATERKVNGVQSPRAKNDTSEKQIKLSSPKKKIRVISSQASERVLSPKKSIQNKNTIISLSMEPQQLKSKKKKESLTEQFENESNYLLIGDSFIQIDEIDTRGMQSQIFLNSEKHEKEEEEFVWTEFMNEKEKLERQFFSADHSNLHTDCISNQTKLKVNQNPFKFQEPAGKLEFPKLQQSSQSACFQREEWKESIEQQIPFFHQSYQGSESSVQPYKSSYIQQDQIKARQKAINLRIKAQTQVLNRLLESGKIERKQHQAHMDLVIEMYDREVTQIEHLKQLMSQNEQKVASLIENTKNSLQLSSKIGTESAESILQMVFGSYKKSASPQNVQNNEHQISHQLDQSFLQQPYEDPQVQSDSSEQPLSMQTSRVQQNNLLEPSSFAEQHVNKLKPLIENRISSQMGFTVSNIPQGFNTSVTAIYHFITHFFFFLKSFYLEEFLTYANMPYGYNVKQRLMYMQGYDDDDENEGQTIYGLEEVIRPQILDAFHKNFYSKLKPPSQFQQYQITHNRAVFDALNEAINKFRPYFEITGPPYPWTTSEKSLTLFMINEDCVDQMFQKVRLQVLKWATSLCGLIVPEATHTGFISEIETCSEPLTIEQIFQKYTLETDCNLLEQREAKVIKQQKIDTQQTNFQWHFNDEFRTAVLFEISASILEDLSSQFAKEIGITPHRGHHQQ